jgi:tRNA (guanine37-N1)-methyltransferase
MPSQKRSICAKVPLSKGEYYRKRFFNNNLINRNLMIKRIDGFLYIPLLTHPNGIDNKSVKLKKNNDDNIEYKNESFEIYPKRINNYKSLLSLPDGLNKDLPTSFDIIGSIAILKLSDSLLDYSNQIGKAILSVHKNLNSVAIDSGVKGDFRIRKIKIIAGEKNTETIHKEYGLRLILDLSKVYYSPRLGKEHYRVAKLVRSGEVVLDMFAGIGPFAIMISKYSRASQIYSIDINKHAMEYLIKNIDLNKVQNIFPLEGDARKLIHRIPLVDRVIMNLPFDSDKFIDLAFQKMNIHGIIHLHKIINVDHVKNYKTELKEKCGIYGFESKRIKTINLGSYSAKLNHYCFDMSVSKI